LTWKDLKRFISNNNNEEKEEIKLESESLEYSEIFHSGYPILKSIRKPILQTMEIVVSIM